MKMELECRKQTHQRGRYAQHTRQSDPPLGQAHKQMMISKAKTIEAGLLCLSQVRVRSGLQK
ncbi:MAG: hypothetical protein JOZ29_08170 [Deltaproteobacteria bacterium]|nr:hypothetical protein [Deltaproteobacteria bacterium]MBV8452233.1 hypothetical protein [Deltaproteobacteria bacterium]